MTAPRQHNEASGPASRSGLVVVLCGPDGSGKSTIAKLLVERLMPLFPPELGMHCHWKPSAAKNDAPAVTRPHEKQPRNPIASLCFFGYHWLGFLTGMLFSVPRATHRGGLVLIERFYYDFFVDLRRYRLQLSQFFVRCGYKLLPKPDLVFLLDAPPEMLQQRKQEVPLAETARQRDAYRHLIINLPNGRLLDATLPAENVVAEMARQIRDFVAARDRCQLSALDRIESAAKPADTGSRKA